MPPTVPTTPSIRAADRDREAVVAELRDHGAAGRLEVDELAERTQAALAARTLDELAPLTRDLPELAGERIRVARHTAARRELSAHVATFAAVNAALILVWALTGAGYFWPVWSIGGWGIGLFSHWSDVRHGRPRQGGWGCGHRRRRMAARV